MIRVHVRNQRVNRSFVHPSGPLEFGRLPTSGSISRFVLFDDAASRCHLRIQELDGGRVRLENISQRTAVALAGAPPLPVGAMRELELPVLATVGQTSVSLDWIDPALTSMIPDEPPTGFETIAVPVRLAVGEEHHTLLAIREALTPERLLRWFETLVSIQRATASRPDMYRQAVEAVVDLVGMDEGMILLRQDQGYQVVAQHRAGDSATSHAPSYSRSLIDSVVEGKRTLYRQATVDSMSKSLANVESVVASPILAGDDEVVGVLYSARDLIRAGSALRTLGPLEAQVVQLLAAIVGTGLTRLEKEAEAIRARVQFEQFFSRELAEELERTPTLLEGSERTITVLFADIRGFSRMAQQLAPRDYYRMAQEVLARLTARVQEHRGVVVDYTGDGLMAMWNAPFEQPDHAERACRAARAMAGDLPVLSRAWAGQVESLDIGVGISTGSALVGNTGTPQKMKYGPRGHCVNLGSRIEGATKHLGVRIIVADATCALAKGAVQTRRLGAVRLAGLPQPVVVHELVVEESDDVRRRSRNYEQALELVEARKFHPAAELLRQNLVDDSLGLDVPTLKLLARIQPYLKNPPADFDPTWILDSK